MKHRRLHIARMRQQNISFLLQVTGDFVQVQVIEGNEHRVCFDLSLVRESRHRQTCLLGEADVDGDLCKKRGH